MFEITIVDDKSVVIEEFKVDAASAKQIRRAIQSGLLQSGLLQCDDCGAYIPEQKAVEIPGPYHICTQCESES